MKRSKTMALVLAGFSAGIMFVGSCNGGSGSSGTPTTALDLYWVTPGAQLVVASPGLLENDSDGLWVESFDGSSHYGGTVVVNADGGFQYAPPSSTFIGQDIFTYTATDGEVYLTGTVLVVVDYYPAFQLTKVLASDAQAYDYFGNSVAVSGDTAVVGASGEGTGGSGAGAAYVFERDGAGNWVQGPKLTASDAQAGDGFGNSVAVSGDTAVVGAVYEGTGGSRVGAAYVFERDGAGTWIQAAKLTASDAQVDEWFGYSVTVSGDTVVVGAVDGTVEGFNPGAGAAYVFERDGAGNWIQGPKLMASDAQAFNWFGYSVGVSGNTAVVGAPYEATGGFDAGAAYVFERDGAGNWIQATKLMASDAQGENYFGCSVAVSENTAVVGARSKDGWGSNGGAAYVFERDEAGTWIQAPKLTASDAQVDDWFGYSVAVSGDTVVVGASSEDTGGSNAGAAYVFESDGAGNWIQAAKLTASDAQAGDGFGNSVAVSGDTVVVGASFEDTGGANAGAAYLFWLYY